MCMVSRQTAELVFLTVNCPSPVAEVQERKNGMRRVHRLTAGAVSIVMCASILALPVAASASEEGRRNTMLGLGAAAAALLLTQKNKLPGIIAGAGAAYAYKRYDDSINARHEQERYGTYGRDVRDYSDDSRYNDPYYRRYDDRYDNRYYDGGLSRRDDRYYSWRDNRYNDRDSYRTIRRR